MPILLGGCWGDLKMNWTPVGDLGLHCYFHPHCGTGDEVLPVRASVLQAYVGDFISPGW